MKIIIKLIFIVYFCILNLEASNKQIIFGVVPQQSPEKLNEAWLPLVKYLSKTTGYNIVFKTEKSIPEFEKVLYSGGYDIAYSNPYHYVLLHNKQNHNAIVRFNQDIVGVLVTHKNSNIRSIDDIQNKEFLFPAPNAFAATLLTKYEILKLISFNIKESKKIKYVNSHDSVYKGIVRGFGDIGGGIIRTMIRFDNKDKLRIIHKTKPYPSHPISINQDLNPIVVKNIQHALLNIPKEYTNSINNKKLKRINDSEYDIVKQLAIKLNIYPTK